MSKSKLLTYIQFKQMCFRVENHKLSHVIPNKYFTLLPIFIERKYGHQIESKRKDNQYAHSKLRLNDWAASTVTNFYLTKYVN